MKDEIEVVYAQYEGLIVKLAMGHQGLYVDVLGKEDAIQEAGLTVNQSYVIWRTYVNQFTERRIAKTMKVTKTVVHNIISAGLKKLQRFIIHNT